MSAPVVEATKVEEALVAELVDANRALAEAAMALVAAARRRDRLEWAADELLQEAWEACAGHEHPSGPLAQACRPGGLLLGDLGALLVAMAGGVGDASRLERVASALAQQPEGWGDEEYETLAGVAR